MRNIADHSSFSRKNLGEAIPVSAAESENAAMMRKGSKKLLAALWKHHHRAMLVAKACGRLVVHP